ncbi:hypothetical protein RDI58_024449 [Solanum bulbocastanum]|uniref:Uncharacterized protein n=1 Tax=Solanum bulbocastanum TaxID=147425 RepID=A0AAN8Y3N1_SOLBU
MTLLQGYPIDPKRRREEEHLRRDTLTVVRKSLYEVELLRVTLEVILMGLLVALHNLWLMTLILTCH